MDNFIPRLDQAIKQVCPIDGISIGDPNDKKTWRIDFKDNVTLAEKTAAFSVVQTFDMSPLSIVEKDLDDLNTALSTEGSIVRALALVMFEEVNKLRKLSGQSEYNLTQFKTALKNKMR